MTRDTSHTDDPTAEGEATSKDSMRAVSHTNPYTNESMGSLFEQGVTIIADGGERNAVDESTTDGVDNADDPDSVDNADEPDSVDNADEPDDVETPMKEVSHEAPEGGHGNRMFERVGDTADVEDEG